MVFRGKPSKACEPCRLKRRKCDFVKPCCGPCVRAGLPCGGYRDATTLSFRDETVTVTTKAQKRNSPKPRSPKPTSSLTPRSESSPRKWHDRSESLTVPPTIFFNLETVATNYFLEFYLEDTPFLYLARFWNQLESEELVRLAMFPAAIAAFSQSVNQIGLVEQSRRHYSEALTATNKALCQPHLTTLDSTLLSVLLLAMYEALTFRGRVNPDKWATHVNGLSTILQLRKNDGGDSELGRILTLHSSTHILTHCTQAAIPVPRHMRSLKRGRSAPPHRADLFSAVGGLLESLALLRVNMKTMPATEIIKKCIQLDESTQEAMRAASTVSGYTVLVSADSPGWSPGYSNEVHKYQSQYDVRYWNNLRLVRLAVNEWIYCAFYGLVGSDVDGLIVDSPIIDDPLHEGWDRIPANAIHEFETTVVDLLASVPYSRGCFGKSSKTSARYLVWPLAVAAASELCPLDAKGYIIDRLKSIAVQDGIGRAQEAASMLEEGKPLENW